ncbi:hypothetical protein SDC9_97732 [bioreactor metagenome]|uniref:Uncharacterized protein n=1 Tax=bioreactor metagenome TaxID=1076179 RepID=A0A645ADE7_9ZZZZ
MPVAAAELVGNVRERFVKIPALRALQNVPAEPLFERLKNGRRHVRNARFQLFHKTRANAQHERQIRAEYGSVPL